LLRAYLPQPDLVRIETFGEYGFSVRAEGHGPDQTPVSERRVERGPRLYLPQPGGSFFTPGPEGASVGGAWHLRGRFGSAGGPAPTACRAPPPTAEPPSRLPSRRSGRPG